MNRKVLALALFTLLLTADLAGAQANAGDIERAIAPALDSVYMLGIARRNSGGPEVFQFVGTGWVIADGRLATNAHVAEALLESSTEGRLVAKRTWSDRDELALSPSSIRIHPAYGPWNARLKRVIVRNDSDPAEARSVSFIPVADVAIVDVEAGNTAPPLVLADPARVEPALSEAVVYLGFPYENISGFPTLHAVPGYVTAKTDYFFQRAAWSDAYLIHYCGPVVGGASGSPIFNRAGQVLGLISAAENNLSVNGERTSFGFAYGQRVDLARELLRDDYESVQAQRDRSWSERLAGLLLPPDEMLEQFARARAQRDGVTSLGSAQTVTRRQVVVTQAEPARLSVTLEPGLRYGFLAAAHDGSDIDAQVVARAGDQVLGVDIQTDYYPMVWIDPVTERTPVSFDVIASERLLQDTTCSVHVYKYEPQIVAVAGDDEDSAAFFALDYVVPADGGGRATWDFSVAADAHLLFTASSAEGHDVDLALSLDGEIEVTDDSPDSLPLVQHFAGTGGIVELRLQIPASAPQGAVIEVRGLLIAGTKPVPIATGEEGQAPEITFTAEQLYAEIDRYMAEVWKEAGVEGRTAAQDIVALSGAGELSFDVPAGAMPVFVAFAPRGEDIDMEIVVDGQVIAEDKAADNSPMLAIAVAETDRTIVMRLIEQLPVERVDPIVYRLSLVDG